MKRIFTVICGLAVAIAAHASVIWELNGSSFTEKYDFEAGGLYYGIISESRGEVHVMNPDIVIYDPYPYWELPRLPEYRMKSSHDGVDYYTWKGGYYKGDIEVPATVVHNGKTYTVVRIAYGAFAWCEGLKSIKLPSTIREIRYGAFSMCTELTDINLPDGTCVSGGAFYGCRSLKSVDFSKCTFQYNQSSDGVVCQCGGMEEVYLPANWYGERLQCYLIESGPYVIHRRISDYYAGYDDFPLVKCTENHDDLHAPAYVVAQTESISDNSDDILVWDIATNNIELQGCGALRVIHATATVPLELRCGEYLGTKWDDFYEDCTLYVPQGSVEAYSSTLPWSNFKNIVGESNASVDGVFVDAGSGQPRYIYDFSGNLCAIVSDGDMPRLAPGLYLERCGDVSRKLVIR